MSIQFGGVWYEYLSQAAAAWAAAALPDTSTVGDQEDPGVAAEALEAYWWREGQGCGEGAPEGAQEAIWRDACRGALVERIARARKA